jgi:peptidoglycan/LPS O-acetylase OafA/YrhL
MDASSPTLRERYDFLDWLRVLAILVLLFFHTGMMFTGWGWHVENAEVIPSLLLPMDLAHRLRMPLLFVIAGAGMWFALGSRSGAQVVKERSLRLLLPLAFCMFVIVPPQIWYERLLRGQWSGDFASFYLERVLQFQPYPQGDFSWHHLWFIAYLYVYVVLLIPLLVAWRRQAVSLQPGPWLYLLCIPLAVNEALLKPLFPESHNLVSDWYIFNHYLLLTLYGFALASMSAPWDWLARWRHRSLTIALTVFAVAMFLFEYDVIRRDTPADAVVANVFTWSWLMVFIGYGRQHLSLSNGVLRWARDASYPIYILHQTLIVAIGYYVIQMRWTPWTKYWVVLVATMIGCVAMYELVVRRFGTTRLLFGMKKRGASVLTALRGTFRRQQAAHEHREVVQGFCQHAVIGDPDGSIAAAPVRQHRPQQPGGHL